MSINNILKMNKRLLKSYEFLRRNVEIFKFCHKSYHFFEIKTLSLFDCNRLLITRNCQTMRGGIKTEFKRLPSTVTPINYDISLKPNLKSFTFTGSQTIKIKVNEETKQIVLNALELEISGATFSGSDGKSNIF